MRFSHGKTGVFYCCLFLFFFSLKFSKAQLVPYYPPEITLGFIGLENNIPGSKPEEAALFSFTKLNLLQDLPSSERLTNTLSFVGSYERLMDFTLARDYHPTSLNPVLRNYFFLNDIFTLGLELNGNLESIPSRSDKGNIQSMWNKRLRITPFHYTVPHPNFILLERFTLGFSRNSGKSFFDGHMLLNDYDIFRYELKAMYLTKFHFSLFVMPYLYANRYHELPARSGSGVLRLDNPKLNEKGMGTALGFKYHTFKTGIWELVSEYSKNRDEVFGSNSYSTWKARISCENPYFTSFFGYYFRLAGTGYYSDHIVSHFDEMIKERGELAQIQYTGDIMLIFYINKNVSIRPEYDVIYQEFREKQDFLKFRFWFNLHIVL